MTIINWSAAFGGQQQIEALQPEWEKRLAASRPKMCKLESLGRSSQSLVFEKAAGLSPKKTFKKNTVNNWNHLKSIGFFQLALIQHKRHLIKQLEDPLDHLARQMKLWIEESVQTCSNKLYTYNEAAKSSLVQIQLHFVQLWGSICICSASSGCMVLLEYHTQAPSQDGGEKIARTKSSDTVGLFWRGWVGNLYLKKKWRVKEGE